MAKYLVTGGAGFIGSHLVEMLISQGHNVRVLDDLSTGRKDNLPQFAELVVGSVTDAPMVRRALAGMDGCFHLAAIASVERTRHEWVQSHAVNLSGTITVFQEASYNQNRSGRSLPVVYASSAAVYGIPHEIPIAEDSALRPINAYGADKLGSEQHAVVASGLFSVPTLGLRFFNVYGPRQDSKSPYSGVVSVFCRRALRGERMELHGDGKQLRDFVYVADAVNALRLAMETIDLVPRVYNVCTGVGTTISDLGKIISRICEEAFEPLFADMRLGDLKVSVGCPQRAASDLGFRTRVTLRSGLSQLLGFLTSSRVSLST
jgi:UDP-glucose 4-epimerase